MWVSTTKENWVVRAENGYLWTLKLKRLHKKRIKSLK